MTYAAQILNSLTDKEHVTLVEVSDRSGVSRDNCRRIVDVLLKRGNLIRVDRGVYMLSPVQPEPKAKRIPKRRPQPYKARTRVGETTVQFALRTVPVSVWSLA